MFEAVFTLWGWLVVGAVCLTVAGVVDTVAKAWRKAREAEMEASLKAEMIRQGRSADEIERVLKAHGRTTGTASNRGD